MGLYDFTVYDVINRNSRCFNRRRAWLEVKNPRPGDVALVCPQRGFMISTLIRSFWRNGVMERWSIGKNKKDKIV